MFYISIWGLAALFGGWAHRSTCRRSWRLAWNIWN